MKTNTYRWVRPHSHCCCLTHISPNAVHFPVPPQVCRHSPPNTLIVLAFSITVWGLIVGVFVAWTFGLWLFGAAVVCLLSGLLVEYCRERT